MRPSTRSLVIMLLSATALLSAGGCAFDRDWRRMKRADFAATDVTAKPSDPLAGRWEGRWVSASNGHNGKLRAIVTPVDANTYRVEYDAMFFAFLRAGYGTNLTATRQPDGKINFEGQEDLGKLAGGVYRYRGSADGKSFTSTYESSYDHGTFEMTRPKK